MQRWADLDDAGVVLSDGLSVRLARPEDEEFLGEMGDLAGFSSVADRVHDERYQMAVREGLRTPGSYFRTILDVYNGAVPDASAFERAAYAGSFDLVFELDGQRVAAQSVGFSTAVLGQLLSNGMDSRQVISLMMGLPKARGLGVGGRGVVDSAGVLT